MPIRITKSDFTPHLCFTLVFGVVVFCLLFAIVARAEGAEIDMSIIAQIESSNNPLAYNRHSGARGKYQLTEIAWQDVQNNFPSLRRYPFIYAYKPKVALLFAKAYFVLIDRYIAHFGLKNDLSVKLACYNQGISPTRKGKYSKETVNYIAKYHKLAKAR